MARASTITLLSLDAYAKIIGLNPSHFNTGYNADVMPYTDCCTDIWHQYDWQFNGRTSREALAMAIADAERDIAEVLGYWPAPTWTVEEVRQYPTFHRPDFIQYGTLDTRGYQKVVKTGWGHVIAPGQRAVSTKIGTPNVVYSTEDGDLINETATVSIATTQTDPREVKVYFAGHNGDQEWELRPARTKAISGGTFTATFWSWQFIDPDLWEALPTTADPTPIDWNQAANLVVTADVYREYNDTTATSSTFYWEPSPQFLRLGALCSACGGTGCVACQLTTQNGCLHVRNAEVGLVVPQVATYDDDDAQWEASSQTVCRDPDYVKIYYYSGLIDQRYLNSQVWDPLPQWWAQTIVWLATSKLERPFCSCDNVVDLVKELRTDLSQVGGPFSYNVTLEDLSNPFGPRKGAVLAWRRVSKLARKVGKVAVI